MKKITLKDLEKLKKEGWDVSPDDQEKVSRIAHDGELRGKIKDIADIIGSFANDNRASNGGILRAIAANTETMQSGFKMLLEALTNPKEYEFDIRRNSKGFISKIFTKQIN